MKRAVWNGQNEGEKKGYDRVTGFPREQKLVACSYQGMGKGTESASVTQRINRMSAGMNSTRDAQKASSFSQVTAPEVRVTSAEPGPVGSCEWVRKVLSGWFISSNQQGGL